MKKISLKVSKMFPCTHPRKGEPTMFKEKILSGEKIHTLRGNYDYWKEKVDQVNSGSHFLCIEQWSKVPYNSKLDPSFFRFPENGQIGIQMIKMVDHGNFVFMEIYDPDGTPKVQNDCIDFPDCKHDWDLPNKLSANDGLSIVDFYNWFRKGKYDLSKPMAIIHFTGFRY